MVASSISQSRESCDGGARPPCDGDDDAGDERGGAGWVTARGGDSGDDGGGPGLSAVIVVIPERAHRRGRS